jgi:hypothetical protein
MSADRFLELNTTRGFSDSYPMQQISGLNTASSLIKDKKQRFDNSDLQLGSRVDLTSKMTLPNKH